MPNKQELRRRGWSKKLFRLTYKKVDNMTGNGIFRTRSLTEQRGD